MNWYQGIKEAKVYDYTNLMDILKKYFGVKYVRDGYGSHTWWVNPENGDEASIPVPKNGRSKRTVFPATLADILSNLGITQGELRNKKRDKPVEPKTVPVEIVPEWQKQPWYQQQQQYQNIGAKNIMNWYKTAKKWKDKIPGGRADGKTPQDFDRSAIDTGKQIEFEHTDDPDIATEISMDHLEEFPLYYDKDIGLPNMERQLERVDKLKKKKK